MKELSRYTSIQELKETSKPIDLTAAKSVERHNKFESFINFLKDDTDKDVSAPQDDTSINPISIQTTTVSTYTEASSIRSVV